MVNAITRTEFFQRRSGKVGPGQGFPGVKDLEWYLKTATGEIACVAHDWHNSYYLWAVMQGCRVVQMAVHYPSQQTAHDGLMWTLAG